MLIRTSKDKDHPYVMINKKFLHDSNLSLKAKGLLAYCMSMPDGWEFHVNQLSSVLRENRTAINSAFKELIEFGYCQRIQTKRSDGKFNKIEYILFETPDLKKSLPRSGFPQADFPLAENRPLVINDVSNEKKQRQQPLKKKENLPEKKVVVVSSEDKEVSNSLKVYLEKFANKHGVEWDIPLAVLEELNSNYGIKYLADQLNYTTKRHEQAIKDESTPYKRKKESRIEKPQVYLSMSCEKNWANSVNLNN